MNYVGILMVSLRRTCQNKSSRQKLKKKKSTFELLAFFKPRVQFVTTGINGERTINVREITWRHRRRKLGNGMGFKMTQLRLTKSIQRLLIFFRNLTAKGTKLKFFASKCFEFSLKIEKLW